MSGGHRAWGYVAPDPAIAQPARYEQSVGPHPE
jgi:hypothetical protein